MKDIINSIRYRDQYHISRKRWLFAVYTISFSIVAVLVFGRFLYYEKSLIGGADGLPQVAAFMKYNGKYYRELLSAFFKRERSMSMLLSQGRSYMYLTDMYCATA